MKRILTAFLYGILMLAAGASLAEGDVYRIGDRVDDFSVTLCDGSEVTLYGLLEEYDAVFLNFFGSSRKLGGFA